MLTAVRCQPGAGIVDRCGLRLPRGLSPPSCLLMQMTGADLRHFGNKNLSRYTSATFERPPYGQLQAPSHQPAHSSASGSALSHPAGCSRLRNLGPFGQSTPRCPAVPLLGPVLHPIPIRLGGRGAVLAGSFARFSRSNFVRCWVLPAWAGFRACRIAGRR